MYALWIENTSESYLPSYKATYAVAKRAQKKGFNGTQTHDLLDTGAMLYQLSYEALYNWKQVKSKFNLYLFYEESEMMCIYDITHTCTAYMYELQIKNTSESDPHSYEATKAVCKKWKAKKARLHTCSSVGRNKNITPVSQRSWV